MTLLVIWCFKFQFQTRRLLAGFYINPINTFLTHLSTIDMLLGFAMHLGLKLMCIIALTHTRESDLIIKKWSLKVHQVGILQMYVMSCLHTISWDTKKLWEFKAAAVLLPAQHSPTTHLAPVPLTRSCSNLRTSSVSSPSQSGRASDHIHDIQPIP